MQKLATPEIRQFIISGVTVIRASANYTKNEKIYLLRQLLSISWRLSLTCKHPALFSCSCAESLHMVRLGSVK